MLISVSPHDSWFNLERVHRLDQLCRKLPAKLFDPRALTRESSANRFGPVIFSHSEVILGPNFPIVI
jgi:hypothetical protein